MRLNLFIFVVAILAVSAYAAVGPNVTSNELGTLQLDAAQLSTSSNDTCQCPEVPQCLTLNHADMIAFKATIWLVFVGTLASVIFGEVKAGLGIL